MLRAFPGPRALAVFAPLALAFAVCAQAAVVPTGFNDQLVASGMGLVSNFDFLPDGRVLVVERLSAKVWLIDPNGVTPMDTIGVIPEVQGTSSEAGLIGIAVDPRWPAKPYIYVDYNSIASPNVKVTRYELTGDLDGTQGTGLLLDSSSRHDILADLPDDFPLHNGGTLLFREDGTLFVSVGDDNVPCSAPDLHELRGKILRLSVLGVPDGPGWAPDYQALVPPDNPFAGNPDPRTRLVWEYGLRNPWTYDYDPATGTMVIADVGNDSYEEIDVTTQAGRNFGWPLYEGPWRFEYGLCTYPDTLTLTPPSYWYEHPPGESAAIILGGLARPIPAAPVNFPGEYMGNVFYVDLYEGVLRRLECVDGTCTLALPVPGQPTPDGWATELSFTTRMRFGPDGALWYIRGGDISRIAPDAPIGVGRLATNGPPSLRAFPTPAVSQVRLSYRLPAAGPATLFVTDARGRLVRTLVHDEATTAGDHVASWDGMDDRGVRVPAGVYFGALRTARHTETRRLVMLGGR
jgi:hypothetical protein